MKYCTGPWILLAVLIVSTFFVKDTFAQDEMLCRGQKLNMTEKQMSFITDCLKEFKLNSVWELTVENMPCFGICAMDKKGLLTADGKLDHDKIYNYIYHVMLPEEVRKPLIDGTELCIKDHGDAIRFKNDPGCSHFLDTGMCVHTVFHSVCNTSK